jgi:hypothetical protein
MTSLLTEPYVGFPKISRLSREMILTEKIDGTNGKIKVTDWGDVIAGSRNRWITPENDNQGFARWVAAHSDELRELGPGEHFGEWWGQGIQRGYGLKEKRFSLFNVSRWNDETPPPGCCYVVPTLHVGPFDTAKVDFVCDVLRTNGSVAAPGYANPEGVVVFHTASHTLFKKTLVNDHKAKAA